MWGQIDGVAKTEIARQAMRGVGLTAHVIGFDLSGEDQLGVSCIAE